MSSIIEKLSRLPGAGKRAAVPAVHSVCLSFDLTRRLLEVITEGEEDEAGTHHARVSRVYLKKK